MKDMKTAFITGIAGQDGSYLAEHLLTMGFRVCGMLRRHSVSESQDYRIRHLEGKIETTYGDMTCPQSIQDALARFAPDWIFNLAAQSHVRISFEVPTYTFAVNANGVLNLLEAARRVCPLARIYQASSSEMFGNNVEEDGCQRITTAMDPTSPYGCAKLAAFKLVKHYRRAYGMHASNGILFNHTSPRRGSNFVEAKIIKSACEIAAGKRAKLMLGNMQSRRDFGHSSDYTRAMIMMLQQNQPNDYLIATGETHSIEDICAIVFSRLGMQWREYVSIDDNLKRPEELRMLRGDSTETRVRLDWQPHYTFGAMIDEIVDHWKGTI